MKHWGHDSSGGIQVQVGARVRGGVGDCSGGIEVLAEARGESRRQARVRSPAGQRRETRRKRAQQRRKRQGGQHDGSGGTQVPVEARVGGGLCDRGGHPHKNTAGGAFPHAGKFFLG